jgi:cell division septum initiation protein DivIVA
MTDRVEYEHLLKENQELKLTVNELRTKLEDQNWKEV